MLIKLNVLALLLKMVIWRVLEITVLKVFRMSCSGPVVSDVINWCDESCCCLNEAGRAVVDRMLAWLQG